MWIRTKVIGLFKCVVAYSTYWRTNCVTPSFVVLQIVAVCHEAAISALQEDFNVIEVCKRHFESALGTVKPRTPMSLINLYKNYSNV